MKKISFLSWGRMAMMFLVMLLALSACSSSDDNGEGGGGAPSPSTKPTADAGNDLYGLLTTADGKGVAGVTVSDGYTCVQTDSRGFYQMKRHRNAQYVFYSTPAGYKARPNQFYQRLSATAQKYDFTLTKEETDDNHFMLIVMADPQVTNNTQLARLKNETMEDLKKTEASTTLPTCGIVLGDIVNDKPDMMGSMKSVLSASATPFFVAVGNHDKVRQTDTSLPRTTDRFEKTFGPLYYSFNRGQVHFICLDDVVFQNSEDYAAGISADELAWMKEDLKQVPKSKMVIVYYHIPLRDSNAPGRTEMLSLLKDYANVKLMCGHTHYLQNYEIQSPIAVEERIHGTACGAWWHSVICVDGTPNGYGVYEIQGNRIVNAYYQPTCLDKSFQIRLFRGNASFGGQYGMYSYGLGDDYIVANVFNYDPMWRVSVYEDGVYSGDMANSLMVTTSDAWATGLHLGVLNRNPKDFAPNSHHDFIYQLKNPEAKVIRVEAVDEYGNTYEQEHFTTDLKEAESYE
ncbi:MAG: calcineurin-like phosphoesterase family protein [Prevotella sp.]|nr:calcineurin-like phosphoesterase family protein [Prevotella sp.]